MENILKKSSGRTERFVLAYAIVVVMVFGVLNPLTYVTDFNTAQEISGMPLRYNNDKQKKPLFSRGLSVCRLLFNSFSKLKIDENYKEKRRLFY